MSAPAPRLYSGPGPLDCPLTRREAAVRERRRRRRPSLYPQGRARRDGDARSGYGPRPASCGLGQVAEVVSSSLLRSSDRLLREPLLGFQSFGSGGEGGPTNFDFNCSRGVGGVGDAKWSPANGLGVATPRAFFAFTRARTGIRITIRKCASNFSPGGLSGAGPRALKHLGPRSVRAPRRGMAQRGVSGSRRSRLRRTRAAGPQTGLPGVLAVHPRLPRARAPGVMLRPGTRSRLGERAGSPRPA